LPGTQIITVTDTEAPVLSGVPATTAASCDNIPTAATPIATDNCDAAPSIALVETSTQTGTGVGHYNYIITRTWTATDLAGNSSLPGTQYITITDNQMPVIICPENIKNTADPGTCGAIIAITNPTAIDNCSTTFSFTGVRSDALALTAEFPVGNTTITWTATDGANNTSLSCDQTVTVTDDEDPTFTAPADIIVCRLNDCTYDISLLVTGDVTNESDNCSTGIEATYSDQLSGPDDCNRDIFIDRKWKLADNSGNKTEKTQIIRIKPLATASIANSTPVICNGSNAVLLFESPTESSITSELKYQVIITSTDPAHLSGGASVGFPLTKPQMPFHLNADLTNSSNAPIEVTYTLESGVSGCSTTTIVSTTVIVNPSGSLLPLSGEIVCNGSSTTEVPFMTLNTGGTSSYNWVNDLPSIGLSSNGSGDRIVAFTGVNNVDKFVTANISVTPFFTFAGLTCEGQMKSFTITVNPTPRVVPVNPDLKPDTSICYGTATAITLTSPTEMTSGSIVFDFTTTASDVSVTGDLSSGVSINPGYMISRSYQNKSNKIQSVYYSITPRNDLNVCIPGKTVISEVKVHPKTIDLNYPGTGGDGVEIVQPLTCEGGSNASLKVHTSTDAGPYYFSWERSSTMKIEGFGRSFVDNLIGGGWQVTVTDALGCKNSSFKDIAGGAAFNTYFNAYKNVTCPGGNDGELAIQENGTGNSPYIYEIHRIYNGKDVIVINDTIETKGIYHYHYDQLPGIYRLFMKDNSGCSNVNYLHPDPPEEIIAEPDSIKAQFMTINETCKGADGTIDIISVTGGSDGFSYSWFYDSLRLNPINITDPQHLKGLVSGNYYLDIKDIKNCIQPETVTVDPPVPLVFTAVPKEYNGVNISCYGLSDGAIEIVPVTGTGPYKYFMKRPDGTELESASPVFSNLSAGKYLTSVIDNNFCMDSVAAELIEPGKLGLELRLSESKAGGFNINCTGQKNGTIDINALNAVTVPVFIWSDGFSGESRKDLPAGSYSVVVVDANNCRAAADTVLTEPTPLSLSFEDVRQPFCPDKPDGSITVNGLGGVKGIDYSYKWSDNSIQSILAGVSAGEYTVLITDMNGCTISGSQKIEALNKTCLVIPNAISPNGDTFNDVWNIGEILLYPQAEVKVFNRLGQIVWRSEKGYPSPWDGTSNGTPLPFDSYHYIIDLHNNSKPFIGSITLIK
jgi:gliding motility-associated-like protein